MKKYIVLIIGAVLSTIHAMEKQPLLPSNPYELVKKLETTDDEDILISELNKQAEQQRITYLHDIKKEIGECKKTNKTQLKIYGTMIRFGGIEIIGAVFMAAMGFLSVMQDPFYCIFSADQSAYNQCNNKEWIAQAQGSIPAFTVAAKGAALASIGAYKTNKCTNQIKNLDKCLAIVNRKLADQGMFPQEKEKV